MPHEDRLGGLITPEEKALKPEDTEPRNNESRPDYILAVGEAAACRLALLDEIFGPHSRE